MRTAKEVRNDLFAPAPDLGLIEQEAYDWYWGANDAELEKNADLLLQDIDRLRAAMQSGNVQSVSIVAIDVGARYQAICDKFPHKKGGRREGLLPAILRELYRAHPEDPHDSLAAGAVAEYERRTGKRLSRRNNHGRDGQFERKRDSLTKNFSSIVGRP